MKVIMKATVICESYRLIHSLGLLAWKSVGLCEGRSLVEGLLQSWLRLLTCFKHECSLGFLKVFLTWMIVQAAVLLLWEISRLGCRAVRLILACAAYCLKSFDHRATILLLLGQKKWRFGISWLQGRLEDDLTSTSRNVLLNRWKVVSIVKRNTWRHKLLFCCFVSTLTLVNVLLQLRNQVLVVLQEMAFYSWEVLGRESLWRVVLVLRVIVSVHTQLIRGRLGLRVCLLLNTGV